MYTPTISQAALFAAIVLIGSHSLPQPDALPAGAKAIEQRQAAASATSATSATVSPTGAPGSFVDGDHSRYEEAAVPPKKLKYGKEDKDLSSNFDLDGSGENNSTAASPVSSIVPTTSVVSSKKKAKRQDAVSSVVSAETPIVTGSTSAFSMPPPGSGHEVWQAWAAAMNMAPPPSQYGYKKYKELKAGGQQPDASVTTSSAAPIDTSITELASTNNSTSSENELASNNDSTEATLTAAASSAAASSVVATTSPTSSVAANSKFKFMI